MASSISDCGKSDQATDEGQVNLRRRERAFVEDVGREITYFKINFLLVPISNEILVEIHHAVAKAVSSSLFWTTAS